MLTNSEIADEFEKVANYLEILNENHFRVQAYRNAARTILTWDKPIAKLVKNGFDLTCLPHIGHGLSQKITALVINGKLDILDELAKEIPQEVCKLLKIPGLGPKRIAILRKELNINSLESLSQAIKEEKIRALSGFGIKSEQKLASNLSYIKKSETRISLWHAQQVAKPLLQYLQTIPEVKHAVIAGSFRRCKETIGDLDVLVTGSHTELEQIAKKVLKYPHIESTSAIGATKLSFYIKPHFQVDIRMIEDKSFGAALLYFTGSKEHNVAIRSIAIKNNLLLNEYGLFKHENLITSGTERDIYQALTPFLKRNARRWQIDISLIKYGNLLNYQHP